MLIAHICTGSSASESLRKRDIASKTERVWESEHWTSKQKSEKKWSSSMSDKIKIQNS